MTRDEALKKMQAVKSYMTSGNPIWSVTEIGEAFDMAIDALEQPERKKGKWINYDKKYTLATCSKCNKITMFELWGTKVKFYDYCPNCGCEMER